MKKLSLNKIKIVKLTKEESLFVYGGTQGGNGGCGTKSTDLLKPECLKIKDTKSPNCP